MTDETTPDPTLVRQEYLLEFFKKYTDLINYVQSLPLHVVFKQNAVTRFDEGMFWTRDGIGLIVTSAPPEPPLETPP